MSSRRSWVLLLPSWLAMSTGCSHPRCPVAPTPPSPIVVAARPIPPCDLPVMPGPISLGATVEPGGYFVPTQKLADLAIYLTHLREWTEAADACIRGRQ